MEALPSRKSYSLEIVPEMKILGWKHMEQSLSQKITGVGEMSDIMGLSC